MKKFLKAYIVWILIGVGIFGIAVWMGSRSNNTADVGAGQGRDALYLASLGYNVTALDSSQVGMDQMCNEAKKKNLEIEGVVADALTTQIDKKYDVILFDMLLHAFEETQQKELLKKYAQHTSDEGMIAIVFPDDAERENVLPTLNTIGTWKIRDEIIIKDIPQIGREAPDYTFVLLCIERV